SLAILPSGSAGKNSENFWKLGKRGGYYDPPFKCRVPNKERNTYNSFYLLGLLPIKKKRGIGEELLNP
ncbi:TPA: hypothetical protein ACJZ6O_002047, partial [Streptococcus pneumoniae]